MTEALKVVQSPLALAYRDPDTGEFHLLTAHDGALDVYPAARSAGERQEDSTTGADYLSVAGEWNITVFNPRAAATGSSKGTVGSAGTTEISIGGGVPLLLGGITFEDDAADGDLLLRDANAVGASLTAISLPSWASAANTNPARGYQNLGWKFENGLTVCGTAAGVCAVIAWKPL